MDRPKTAFTLYLEGIDFFAHRKFKVAILKYTQAIELDPMYAQAYYNRADALVRLGKLDEAIEDYTNAIEIEPWHSLAWHSLAYYDRAQAFFALKKYTDAIRDYTKSIKIDSKHSRHADALLNRGYALTALGKHKEANTDYRMVCKGYKKKMENDPKCASAFKGMHQALTALGKHEEAKEYLGKYKKFEEDFYKGKI